VETGVKNMNGVKHGGENCILGGEPQTNFPDKSSRNVSGSKGGQFLKKGLESPTYQPGNP